MTASAPLAAEVRPAKSPKSPGWWGMAFLCVTEGMLFATFLATYLYLHGSVVAFGAEGGTYPALELPLLMTAVLLVSSATMEWGARGMARGVVARARVGLAATFLLGAFFLVLQLREHARQALGADVNALESVMITTTTFHGMHVVLGLLMNAYAQAAVWRGEPVRTRREIVENVTLYWHFVDGVWLALVAVLYLSPRLW